VLLYLQEDKNTQVFFLNGRYPKREHFEAVYKALERLDGEATATDVHRRAAEVAQPKVRVVLAAMKDLEMADEPSPGSFRLIRRGLSPDELDAMAASYEQRAEGDRDRLRRMLLYAQTALCRWKAILDYFGEELDGERCGNCDNCSHPILQPLTPPRAEIPVRPPRPEGEVLPLPPILGDRDPSSLREGDVLTLSLFGTGEVKSAGPLSLVLVFADGETREFRRP
jgi:ATP-dependent DNA helicase RecQ